MTATPVQRILVLVSSGPSTPARCAAPFYTATLLACMEAEVTLFLSGEAGQLAITEVADNLRAVAGGEPIRHFIQQDKQAGVRILLCRAPGVTLEPERLIPELDEIASGGELAQMILEYDRVVSL